MITDQFVLMAVAILIGAILALIIGIRWYLHWKGAQTPGAATNLWVGSRKNWWDPLHYNSPFFQVGLIVSLALTLLAFNWAKSSDTTSFMGEMEILSEEIDLIPPNTYIQPPQPIPEPPVMIEEIPDEEILEEEMEFVDNHIDEFTDIFIQEPKNKQPDLPKTAPVPKIEAEDEGEIFMRVERMPVFPGCETAGDQKAQEQCTQQKIFQFVFQHLKYPAVARENGINGTVVLTFVIDKNGALTDAAILRDIGGGCGEAALQTLRLMQEEGIRFTPGQQQAKSVKVRYSLPVRFRLE